MRIVHSLSAPVPGFDQAREIRSRCSFLEFQFAIQKFALRLEPHDATILDNCLSLADEIVKQTEALDSAGGLRWLPDLPMTGTTTLALFLKDVRAILLQFMLISRLCGACRLNSRDSQRRYSAGFMQHMTEPRKATTVRQLLWSPDLWGECSRLSGARKKLAVGQRTHSSPAAELSISLALIITT
jgi:hypothetical protein